MGTPGVLVMRRPVFSITEDRWPTIVLFRSHTMLDEHVYTEVKRAIIASHDTSPNWLLPNVASRLVKYYGYEPWPTNWERILQRDNVYTLTIQDDMTWALECTDDEDGPYKIEDPCWRDDQGEQVG